jgi:hypothetical protein
MLMEEKFSNITLPGIRKTLRPATRISCEIAHKYGKFTDQEIPVLNDRNHLVAKVQPIYRLDRPEAQTAVDALAKGRQLVMRICQVVALGNCRGR